jgi:hypothetical protein
VKRVTECGFRNGECGIKFVARDSEKVKRVKVKGTKTEGTEEKRVKVYFLSILISPDIVSSILSRLRCPTL